METTLGGQMTLEEKLHQKRKDIIKAYYDSKRTSYTKEERVKLELLDELLSTPDSFILPEEVGEL